MTPADDILPPRYRDPALIGYGGMGEIYRAHDELLGRTVAIKLLAERFAQDEHTRGRFTREALAAARLSGEPHTITIFDVGEHGGRPFIVMEHLDGGSLEEVLRSEGRQPPERVLAWLEQACEALDGAHRHGVVHRDVKPGNLLLASDGTLRVADFGVASAAGLASLTATGIVLGTAGYLAPEQARGEPTTAATDLYALAVVAYELLTGRRPFESNSPTAEATAQVHAPIPRISEHADLPPTLDPVFERALAKDPADRFPTCSEFVDALREALQGESGTRVLPAKATGRSGGPGWPVFAAAVLAATALVGAGVAAILASRDDEPEAAPQVLTRTLPGTTVRETVRTTVAEPPPPAPAPRLPPAPSAASGRELTEAATARLERDDWAGAESLARQAVQRLEGSGDSLYLAYALYLGRALAELGRCEEALPLLARSEQLQGRRKDIDRARKKCRVR
ncbi:MAG TPA: serine/threonine-protein kinase [Gaiellaceae bacterium]|nr:serine/threonine-protein kinase [Gaiellaceae bacterium]